MRTGDTVKHIPSGERWLLAWADERYVYPYGWPESMADVKDCVLLITADDEKHLKCLREVAASKSNRYSTLMAQQFLAEKVTVGL